MAKTYASRKAKGRRLQQEVVKKILEAFPSLSEKDVVSVPMGVSSSDVMLSEQAQSVFNYAIECKNTEKLSIWKSIEQCERESRDGIPLLIFKRNRSDVYCCLKFDNFLSLIKE